MGIAGDMFMGALLELVPDKTEFINRLNQIGIPNVTISAENSIKCGIIGTHVSVKINGEEEQSQEVSQNVHKHNSCDQIHQHQEHHHEEHHHDHPIAHHHSSMQDIADIINALQVPEQVKKDVVAIYNIIAEAESKVHGKQVSEVHFHEVGMMDAIADITGCALLVHELQIDQMIAAPVNVGFGQVKCAHGILPVPAPATANILVGIPSYAGAIRGELCTPTGAALLKYFATSFSNMPPISIEKIGYGMGTKDFEAANCVRVILGSSQEQSKDEVLELSCNLDDMTPEEIGYASEVLLENGALDVFTTPIGMKKSRPGILLSILCKVEDREKVAGLLFRHTTTIGIREYKCNRMILQRKERVIHSAYGEIRLKESFGYGVNKEKMEYEDLRNAADEAGISIREIKEMVKNSIDSSNGR
jgi:uncharacterized protein (TIGR00299 family) protein